MISARAGKLDRDFAFTVGADDYVKKPFRTADLVARLGLLVPAGPSPVPAAPKPQPMARPARRPSPVRGVPAFAGR
jgi:DNA-binding response OmpR family regulator